jgi:hypothetical protein
MGAGQLALFHLSFSRPLCCENGIDVYVMCRNQRLGTRKEGDWMRIEESTSAMNDCAQQCEERLAACLDGNSRGTCQLKYNRCRFKCEKRESAIV